MRRHGGCAAPAAWSLGMPSPPARAERDPTNDLRGALTAPKVNHRAAILEPTAIGALLRAIDGFRRAPDDGKPHCTRSARLC